METKTCSAEGCESDARSVGFCGKHYMKWRTYGDPLGGKQRAGCAVEGCGELQQAKGYCKLHYARWKRTGDPGEAGRRNFPAPARCVVDGCDNTGRLERGLCPKHRSRLTRHGDVNANPKPVRGQCAVIGCDRPHEAKGYCKRHYWMWWKHGEPEPGGYQYAHYKIYRLRGAAGKHTCEHCGKQARHWAYDHQDPAERNDPRRGGPYSLDPWHYIPLCSRCHKAFDRKENHWAPTSATTRS